MLFNSLVFLIFLAIFLLLWGWVKGHTLPRLGLIFAASSIFYGWWDWRFLFLIYFTGTVDFFLARGIEYCRKKGTGNWVPRIMLIASIVCGIGILSIFKYSSFFAEHLNSVLRLCKIDFDLAAHIPAFCLILPVGISFYTFQSLSYTIDVYRGRLQATHSLLHYMSYLMLFPQLVAGPIVRASDLLPKLLMQPAATATVRYNALKMVALGFFKKCVLADNAAGIVDAAFSSPQAYNGSFTWLFVMVMFSIQIYCDFSGYSDIARGIIKFMGYRFNLNFNHPYAACGLRDFWSRWHISLSSWFKDYVYIPLGGSRKGRFRECLNLLITFLISGLWHGASMNFVIWGAYHGILQIVEKVSGLTGFLSNLRNRWLIALFMLLTQLTVLIGWIFFRASTWSDSMYILRCLTGFASERGAWEMESWWWIILIIFIAMEMFLLLRIDCKLLRKVAWYRRWEPIGIGLLMVATVLYRGEVYGFIYFQF